MLFGESMRGSWTRRKRSRFESVDREKRVRVAQKHENIPNAELRRKRNRVVEKSEVPASAIRCGHDVEACLSNPTILASTRNARWRLQQLIHLPSSWQSRFLPAIDSQTHPMPASIP